MRNELAFSRTVVAPAAPEVAVPEELQAAVLVPPPSRREAPPAMETPVAAPAQAAMPPALPPAVAAPEPAAATSPYPALPIERTPAIAVAAIDIPIVAERTRPALRRGTALAVAALGLASGLGLTLLIGNRVGGETGAVATARSSPLAPASPARAGARPAAEPAAKVPATTVPTTQTAAATPAPGSARESHDVPVSSTTVPSCRQLLGTGFAEKNDPEAALAETQAAHRELVRGKVDASQAAFCKAALWDSEKIERWVNLSQIFLIRRDDKKALESVERALELDPKNARALEILGDARARLGDLKEAQRAYLDAERRPEPDAAAREWLVRRDMDEAQRSAKSRDFVRAERLFRRVGVFAPNHAGAALGVATCLRRLGEPKASEAWERHAEKLARSATQK